MYLIADSGSTPDSSTVQVTLNVIKMKTQKIPRKLKKKVKKRIAKKDNIKDTKKIRVYTYVAKNGNLRYNVVT